MLWLHCGASKTPRFTDTTVCLTFLLLEYLKAGILYPVEIEEHMLPSLPGKTTRWVSITYMIVEGIGEAALVQEHYTNSGGCYVIEYVCETHTLYNKMT